MPSDVLEAAVKRRLEELGFSAANEQAVYIICSTCGKATNGSLLRKKKQFQVSFAIIEPTPRPIEKAPEPAVVDPKDAWAPSDVETELSIYRRKLLDLSCQYEKGAQGGMLPCCKDTRGVEEERRLSDSLTKAKILAGPRVIYH